MFNLYVIGISEGKEREVGVEKIFEKSKLKNFQIYQKHKFTHTRSSANLKLDKCEENPSRHIMVKLLKTKNKERILKEHRQK